MCVYMCECVCVCEKKIVGGGRGAIFVSYLFAEASEGAYKRTDYNRLSVAKPSVIVLSV